MKKISLLALFFFLLVVFNILNIVDKVTTYYGIQLGLGEQNVITIKFFNLIGILPTLILLTFVGVIASLSIYSSIVKLSPKIKHIEKIFILPTIFLSLIYFEAVINNMRLLLG